MSRDIACYGLYDLQNNGICIGLYTTNDIVKEFEITKNSLYCLISRKHPLKRRYEVVRVDLEDDEDES